MTHPVTEHLVAANGVAVPNFSTGPTSLMLNPRIYYQHSYSQYYRHSKNK